MSYFCLSVHAAKKEDRDSLFHPKERRGAKKGRVRTRMHDSLFKAILPFLSMLAILLATFYRETKLLEFSQKKKHKILSTKYPCKTT